MKHYDRVWAEVDLDALTHNVQSLKDNIKETTKIIAVIKTDAYGHGAIPIAREIEEKEFIFGFATATYEEAHILRKAGITKPILLLGYTFPYCYEAIIKEELIPAVFKVETLKALSEKAVALQKKCKVHIKVDTGMSRIGIAANEEGLAFIREIKNLQGIEIEGIFSHFAKSDEIDKTAANKQIDLFQAFVHKVEGILGFSIPLKHCSNSAGAIELKNADFDLVRPGIALYGMWPSEEVDKKIVDLKPVLSLKSHIIYIKEIQKGDAVSYGGTYIAEENKKIATVPVGYGDGYPRGLSNKGFMLVNGERAPIIGRVCMDQCMLDISHIKNVVEYKEVTLVGMEGNEVISMEELGEISGRFNYELACDLGKRIPRVYKKNGEIIATKDYFSDYE